MTTILVNTHDDSIRRAYVGPEGVVIELRRAPERDDDTTLAFATVLDAMPPTFLVDGPRGGLRKMGEIKIEVPGRSYHPKIERSERWGWTIWNVPIRYRGTHADPIDAAVALLDALAGMMTPKENAR